MAADTNTLLKGILNVVSRTETHIAEINKKIGSAGSEKSPAASVSDTIKGVFGAGSGAKSSSSNVEKKLDIIIDLLSGKKSSNESNGIGGIAAGINSISNGLAAFKKVSKTGTSFNNFINQIINPLEKLGTKKVTDGIQNLSDLGKGILSFSKEVFKAGLMMAISLPLLPIFAVSTLAFGKIFSMIGEKGKSIREGSKTIADMGKGLIYLAGGIALFTLTTVASGLALKAFGFPGGALSVIAGLALTTILLGTAPVQKGVRSLKDMGKGFLFLAGGIALLSLSFALSAVVMKNVGVGGMIGGGAGVIAAIGGLTLMMVLLGLPPVAKGAKTLKEMGVGMLFLAGGIAIMGLSFALISKYTGISAMEVGAAISLAVLGIGGAMWLMGKQANGILKGSLGLIIASVGLVIFAYGLKKTFDALAGKSWEDIGKLGTVVGGLMGVVTLVGNPFTVGFTYAGAGALAAVGGAMWLLGKGLSGYMASGAEKFDGDGFANTMSKLHGGFMALLGDDANQKESGVWGALKSLGKTVVGGSKIAIAVAEAIGIGAALSSMAKGIGAWANLQNIQLIKGYDKDGNPIYSGESVNIETAINNVIDFIGDGKTKGIMVPFINLSTIGGISKSGFSLFKMITGNDLGDSPFKQGISAAVKIGDVLSSMAEGIGAWANLQNIPLIAGYDSKGKPIFKGKVNIDTAIANINAFIGDGSTTGIMVPFVNLANNGNIKKSGDFSLFKFISGNDLSDSPFQIGISSAVKIGDVLSSLAEGVGNWGKLESIPLIAGYDSKGKAIYRGTANATAAMANINAFLPQILQTFANFADNGSSGWSVTKFLIGDDLGQTPTERGLSNALKIGEILSKVAGGISTFAQLQSIPIISGYDAKGNPIISGYVNVDTAIKNAATAITKVIDAIAATAGVSKGGGSFWERAKNAVLGNEKAEGVEAMAAAILPVSEVLANFATGINTFANLQNIKVVESIDPKTGKPIYSKTPVNIDTVAKNIGTAIKSVINAFSNTQNAGDIEDAVDSMTDINEVLKNFAEPLKAFSTINNADGAMTMFKTVADRLLILGNRATQFEKFANSFEKMSKSMTVFTGAFVKMKPENIKSFGDWVQSLTNFSTMKPADFEANLKLVKKTFGVGDDNTTPTAMTESKGGVINYFGEKSTASTPFAHAPKSEPKVDKTDLLINAMNDVKNAINTVVSKLDDLDVRVVGPVYVKDSF